jgi:hypothetical protein
MAPQFCKGFLIENVVGKNKKSNLRDATGGTSQQHINCFVVHFVNIGTLKH